jgi:hypothetical protein
VQKEALLKKTWILFPACSAYTNLEKGVQGYTSSYYIAGGGGVTGSNENLLECGLYKGEFFTFFSVNFWTV